MRDDITLLTERVCSQDYIYFSIDQERSLQEMILSMCRGKDKIIISRSVNASVIDAIIAVGCEPIYIPSEVNKTLGIDIGACSKSIKAVIEQNPDAKAILLTNPTYHGMVIDMEEIIKLCHERNIAVLADERYSHFHALNNENSKSAINLNADMVVTNSMLFLNKRLIESKELKSAIEIMRINLLSQSSPTSLNFPKEKSIRQLIDLSRYAREKINRIDKLYAFGKEVIVLNDIVDFDETKLTVEVKETGLTGFEVSEILESDYNIQVDLKDLDNILFIISKDYNKKDIDKLIYALDRIANSFRATKIPFDKSTVLEKTKVLMTPRNAYYARKEKVLIEDAKNCLSGELVTTDSISTPLLIPGENISEATIDYIKLLKRQRVKIHGLEDENLKYINIIRKNKKSR